MTLKDFYNKYNGQKNVGNTTANIGECVGLSSLWMDNFSIPHVYGNADDLYTNASDEYFIKIPNTADAICQDGDIIVWGFNYNHSYGHTGIAYGNHDINTFECFEQNDPLGSTPHIKKYNYAYVIGWLRPKAYHGEETPKPPLQGLAVDVGYNPTFEGQDVMVNGVHYKSIKDAQGNLIWKYEVTTPPPVETPVESQPESTKTASGSSVETPPKYTTVSTADVPVSTPEPTLPIQSQNEEIPSNQDKIDLFKAFSQFFVRLWKYLGKYLT